MIVKPEGGGAVASMQRELRIPSRNPQLTAAIATLVERCAVCCRVALLRMSMRDNIHCATLSCLVTSLTSRYAL